MPSYNAIEFNTVTPGRRKPLWERETLTVETHIPYSNLTDTQGMGRGYPQATVPIELDSEAEYESLVDLADGITPRTLIWFGTTYTDVRLMSVTNGEDTATQSFACQVVFKRGGT